MAATSAESVTVGSGRTRALTQGGEVHQARKSGDPVVRGVNNTTTVKLEG